MNIKSFDHLLSSILFGEAKEGVSEFDDLEKGLGFDAAGKRAEGNDLDHAAKMYNNLHEIYLDLYEGVEEVVEQFRGDLKLMLADIDRATISAGNRTLTLEKMIKRKDIYLGKAKDDIKKLEDALKELGIHDNDDDNLGRKAKDVKERMRSLGQDAAIKAKEIKKLKRRGQEEREMYEMMLDDYEELVRRIDLERRRALKLLSIANQRLTMRRTGTAYKRVDAHSVKKAERKRWQQFMQDNERRAKETGTEINDEDIPF